MSRVLVLNTGSSSLKYRLFDGAETVAKGLVEEVTDHARALQETFNEISLDNLDAVGHRVVHGGADFTRPTRIDDDVVRTIERLIPLAPLHNPANLAGIETARKLLPDVPQVAVFDTAFHSTLPPEASTYAIDMETATANRVRRYGFHGTSHAYVSRRTAALLNKDPEHTNVITLHLGNGASACAVEGGRSVATSMGLSPLEGLVMGTRSGSLDPAIIFHLHRVGGLSLDEIDELLNKRSGLRGLAGVSDMREVERRRQQGDEAATLAFDVCTRRIKELVGSYYAVLGRVDAITFTAGVGENSAAVRAAALAGLGALGIEVDADRNAAPERGERVVSSPESRVTVCVVPTDEELEIATQTRAVLGG
ncbi:acetate kinase [Catenuloplanes japonicus]|uniref:acetate kinase n=1 Tax=Catenuloplanes japonicus TaxID=33876 RepID=UPI0005243244|nr:acetate kinase [Catenuloplanes japonicus]